MAQAAAVGALLGASTAFLAPSAAPAPAPALRGAPHSSRDSTGPGLAGAAGVGAAALGLGLLAARPAATACRAAAVKKKGVKVVHGKEIPWNLFSPKAPYQGKVLENDVHKQTLTEPTGDANWETTHVTFDHGGKVPYIEGQSIGGSGFAVMFFSLLCGSGFLLLTYFGNWRILLGGILSRFLFSKSKLGSCILYSIVSPQVLLSF